MTEVPLAGGHNAGEVVRVGATVRRRSSHGTGFAVRVLSCLESAGYPSAPRYRGVDGLPVAFIDWDSCRPGDRLDDLGYLAWTWCIESQGRVPVAAQARHLRELRDGYGDVEAEVLVRAILRRQTEMAETERANLQDPRHSAERRRHAEWAVAWATADRQVVEDNSGRFLAALR